MTTTTTTEQQRVRDVDGRGSGPPAGRRSRRRQVGLVLVLAALAALTFGVRRWAWGRTHQETDDAQVDGPIIPILAKVGGFVSTVRVVENVPVRAGDTLAVLDDSDLRARAALTMLGVQPGWRLADIGCGNGVLACEAALLGAEVDAIDISPAMLALADIQARDRKVAIRTQPAGLLSFAY